MKKLLEQYEKEVSDIQNTCITSAWYMRGGISYTDIMNMSSGERMLLSKLIENNLEVTKKTKMPFF